MSNTIRYDSLLARHLALELHALMTQQRVQAIRFDRAIHAVFLELEKGTLSWSVSAGPAFATGVSTSGPALVLPRKPRVHAVAVLPDERVLQISIAGGARDNAVSTLVIELLPPQPNVIALDAAGRVLKVLLPGAAREQTRGQPYQAPRPLARAGLPEPLTLEEWTALLAGVSDEECARALTSRVAYLSPINAQAVCGTRGLATIDWPAAHQRYLELVTSRSRPCLLTGETHAGQPYGHALWGESRPHDSLLEAFLASQTSEPASAAVQRLEQNIAREQRKLARLTAEHADAREMAQRLRADADLLLAQANEIGRGRSEIELVDFQGDPRRLQLDPALSSTGNAQAWYTEARKRERASEKLPALMEASRRVLANLEDQLRRARAGEAVDMPARPAKDQKSKPEPRLPFQRFRTSGGLEVRVGRNRRDNDELTLHHCAPNDIWMHAREVGGAHVVLRWTDPEANPPRRDLEQAAMLAALHSKARHSGVVPVDWTRRKYVRKPRKAADGSVSVERVKTIFVRPEEDQLTELRWRD